MPAVDLNAARAARREGKDKAGPEVKFGRRTFKLPVELPFEAVQHIVDMGELDPDDEDGRAATPRLMLGIVRGILGDDFGKFMAERPSTEDVAALVEGVLKEYGLDAGELPASAES